MPSSHFNNLKKNELKLRTKFIDFSVKILGNYSYDELIQFRAYFTFAHAEIEVYLERRAEYILKKAEQKWNSKKASGRVIPALVTYLNPTAASIGEQIKSRNSKKFLTTVVGKVIASHTHNITQNHGIREKNFSKLFIPLGVDNNDLPTLLIDLLENIGSMRGRFVHRNLKNYTTIITNPFDHINNVTLAIAELETFDEFTRKHI